MADLRADEPVVTPARRAGATRAGPPARGELREAFSYCVKLWLVTRVALALLALLGVALLPANDPADVPGWPAPAEAGGWHNLVTAWERWDALWFLRIATDGYALGDFSAAFFPLYPLLIKAAGTALGGHPLAGALLVSNLAFLGALVVVYLLTREEFDRDIARKTTLYLAVFPTAYFFWAPYSESLFLLLAASALWAARRDRWVPAGGLGALACATRSVGLVLVVALAVEALRRFRLESPGTDRVVGLLARLTWSGFASLGLLAYFAYWRATAGEWFAPVSNQGGWLREFSWPWMTLLHGTRAAFRFVGGYPGGYHMLDWLIVAVILAAAVWVVRRASLPYSVYVILSLVLALSFIFGGRPFMSLPRFALPMFPLFWALAHFARRYRAHEAIVAVSAAGLGVMTVLFVNWYFVF